MFLKDLSVFLTIDWVDENENDKTENDIGEKIFKLYCGTSQSFFWTLPGVNFNHGFWGILQNVYLDSRIKCFVV